MANTITLKCKFIDCRFKADNGYTIAIYSTKAAYLSFATSVRGNNADGSIIISAKGEELPTTKKFDILLTGTITVHPNYGITLNCTKSEIVKPSSEEGIINYLSDFVKGVGPATAKKIVKAFGEQTLKKLESDPECIYEVKGIRKKVAKEIVSSFEDVKKYAELSELLSPYDISAKRIKKIYNHFTDKKTNAADVIKENPFILAEMHGFSFLTLDGIGRDFNLPTNDIKRIKCALLYVLRNAENEGHLCLKQKELIKRAHILLNDRISPYNPNDIPVRLGDVINGIKELAKENKLLGDNNFAYRPDNYIYEQKVSRVIAKLLNTKVKRKDFERYVAIAEQSLAIELSKSQRKAVIKALNNQISIITGGAGTGKTTVLKVILKSLYKMGLTEDEVLLTAPTGKAAQRMKESTGHNAFTIHSALGIKADEDMMIDEEDGLRELEYKLIVVDESSMMDMQITYKLFSSINPQKTRVILLGDTGQLPSVGAGNVLHELMACGVIPITELKVIFRQAQENFIVGNATNIRNGIQSVKYNDDFQYFEEKSPEKAAELISNMYINEVLLSGLDNVQILSPLRDNGACSVFYLNKRVQEQLNPPADNKAEEQIGNRIFRVGDRVIQTKNAQKKLALTIVKKDEDGKAETVSTVSVYNGDTGKLLSITRDDNKQLIFTVDFGYGRTVQLERDDMYDVDLAYALTIHRSQGSEYKTVIIPLLNYFSDKILFRNLLYTGVTRAKEHCIIVGSEAVIHKCIRVNRIVQRNTQLAWRIAKETKSEEEYLKQVKQIS